VPRRKCAVYIRCGRHGDGCHGNAWLLGGGAESVKAGDSHARVDDEGLFD